MTQNEHFRNLVWSSRALFKPHDPPQPLECRHAIRPKMAHFRFSFPQDPRPIEPPPHPACTTENDRGPEVLQLLWTGPVHPDAGTFEQMSGCDSAGERDDRFFRRAEERGTTACYRTALGRAFGLWGGACHCLRPKLIIDIGFSCCVKDRARPTRFRGMTPRL